MPLRAWGKSRQERGLPDPSHTQPISHYSPVERRAGGGGTHVDSPGRVRGGTWLPQAPEPNWHTPA